jgi:hypothetical protein
LDKYKKEYRYAPPMILRIKKSNCEPIKIYIAKATPFTGDKL